MFKPLTALPYYAQSAFTLLTKTNALEFFINTNSFLLKTKGLEFQVGNFMDIWAVKEVMLDDCYQVADLNIQTAIDIGVGIGDFCVWQGKVAKKIIGVEADKKRGLMARANLKRNQVKGVVVANEFAKSLDKYVADFSQKSVDLVKIDCEGAEYEIIENTKLSTFKKIERLVFEVHLYDEVMKKSYPKLVKKLKQAGFSVQFQPNPVHTTIGFLFAQKTSH